MTWTDMELAEAVNRHADRVRCEREAQETARHRQMIQRAETKGALVTLAVMIVLIALVGWVEGAL